MPILLGRCVLQAFSLLMALSCMAMKAGKSLLQQLWSNDLRFVLVCCIRKAEYKSRCIFVPSESICHLWESFFGLYFPVWWSN